MNVVEFVVYVIDFKFWMVFVVKLCLYMQVIFWMMACGLDLKNKKTGFAKKKCRIIKKMCSFYICGQIWQI
jgi:hypothetical protein